MLPFFQRSNDWKASLSREDEKKLNLILRKIEKHRNAYTQASNVKTAQLWAAILEIEKEKNIIEERLRRIEYIFGGMAERLREEDAGKFKEEKDLRNLIDSLEKF